LATKTTRRNENKNNKKNNNVNKMSKEYSGLLFEAENPFSLPNDNDIFHLTEEKSGDENGERNDKKKKKRPLKAHEKTTYISRMNATNTQIVKDITAAVDEEFAAANIEQPPKDWDLGVAKDRIVEKEGMEDYIGKKREMFFTRFLHRAKDEEMRRLTAGAKAKQIQLNSQQKHIVDKARAFDAFLKEMDKTSIGVLREAEDQTNLKLELQMDVKRLNAQIMAVISEIQKHADTYKEYQLYKRFLDSLAPHEWKEAKRASHELKKVNSKFKKNSLRSAIEGEGENAEAGEREEGGEGEGGGARGNAAAAAGVNLNDAPSIVSVEDNPNASMDGGSVLEGRNTNYNALLDIDEGGIDSDSDDENDADDGEEEEEPELYFTDPTQLLDILGDLEEQNLSLIQNSQETEETLDGIKSNIREHQEKMREETETLKRQIDILEIAIQKEQERERELERKYATLAAAAAAHGGGGEGKEGGGGEGGVLMSEEERNQRALERRVAEIYKMCIGDEESNISTLQMLTNIEICMEELLCFMERTPKEKLEAAEQVKEQERKDLLKKELLEAGKRMAEERRKREIERANADVKPKKGKQLVFRSEPPPSQPKPPNQRMKQMIQEEEELYYFFKW